MLCLLIPGSAGSVSDTVHLQPCRTHTLPDWMARDHQARVWDVHDPEPEALGSHEQVPGWTREQLLSFWQRWYVPANATLFVVGDFDRSVPQIVEMVEKLFGPVPAGKTRQHKTQTRQDKTRQVKRMHLFQPAWLIRCRICDIGSITWINCPHSLQSSFKTLRLKLRQLQASRTCPPT